MNEQKTTPKDGHFLRSVKDFFQRDLVQYIIKRLLMFIPTLFLISVLVFFVIQLPETDYVDRQISKLASEGEYMSQAEADALRAEYGLDLPIHERYIKWISGIIWTPTNSSYYRLYGSHHDWKYSFAYGRNVLSVINDRLPLTILVSALILIFQYGVSLPIAVYASTHQYSVGDYIASFFGFLGAAIPNFILAFMLMYWSYKWTGNANVGLYLTGFFPFLKSMIIPFLVIGTSGTCGTLRSMRAQMLDELGKNYVLCARAKGVSEKRIIYKYCLRAALNPTVSGLSGSLASIFSGSTISAIVMNLQIVGPTLYNALKSQDMYLAGTILLVMGFLICLGTLLSDILLAWLDPRIRFMGRSAEA